MTLTSEKTASKRHAWLVGATTAAMAVALIGVGPVAANAAPGDAGVLDFTVAPQSAPTTPFETGVAGVTDANLTFSGAAFTAKVTTDLGGTSADVTSQFTFAAGATSSDVTLGLSTTTAPSTGTYTLTLTPKDFATAAVPGAVTQQFQVIGGQIYVNGTADNAEAIKLVAPVVKATYGALPGTGTSLQQNGATVDVATAPATGGTEYVPAGASYNVVAKGASPRLSAAPGNSPFATTVLTGLPDISGVAALAVSTAEASPVTFADTAPEAWAPSSVSPFNDVSSSAQFYSQMSWLNATGVSTGYADGGYHPAATIKRNAMAAFLYRLAGSPEVSQDTIDAVNKKFFDLSASTQFDKEIAWLYQQGITTGYTSTTFRPAANVTRGAMAAFLYRFVNNVTTATTAPAIVPNLDAPASNYIDDTFTDVTSRTQFAGDIAWLADAGHGFNPAVGTPGTIGTPVANGDEAASAGVAITSGYASDGGFHPNADIKRNAMAAFLYRLAGE